MQNKMGVWAGGAALAVIAIFAAAYFLLIGPVMDSTAATDDQRTQVEGQNQALRTQNATLRTQFAHIDQMREQLTVLHEQIPAALEWNSFTTLVGDLANANGVVVTNLAGQPAVAVGGTAAAASPGAPADGTTASAPGAAAATGLAIPVTLSFQGAPAGALGTIAALQGVDQRLFLVQTVEIKGLKPAPDAQPPVAPGDTGVVISGYVFVQPPVTAVPDQQPPQPWNNSPFAPSS